MRFPHNIKIFRGQLDAAPFLGVFLLLLLFLLFSSSLVFVPGVPIRLPAAAPMPGPDGPTLVVAVDRSGQFYFENQLCDEFRLKEKLEAALAQATMPPTLIIQADKDVRYEVLMRLGLLARTAGVKEALWAARPQATPSAVAPRPSKI
jgi:biopolymer transport protein ExbD